MLTLGGHGARSMQCSWSDKQQEVQRRVEPTKNVWPPMISYLPGMAPHCAIRCLMPSRWRRPPKKWILMLVTATLLPVVILEAHTWSPVHMNILYFLCTAGAWNWKKITQNTKRTRRKANRNIFMRSLGWHSRMRGYSASGRGRLHAMSNVFNETTIFALSVQFAKSVLLLWRNSVN